MIRAASRSGTSLTKGVTRHSQPEGRRKAKKEGDTRTFDRTRYDGSPLLLLQEYEVRKFVELKKKRKKDTMGGM